ncbi:MAG: hypothetical protein G01um101425_235 [Candidatus Peregrinibacteria bacterium Gr01-1014_25]|nr:MAG: hypothetical protein G01um101425_235 [Candidatus Peregrinibacteria bacterium Gr01-1014_25]
MGRPAFPFHGIFSSLQQEGAADPVVGAATGDRGVPVRSAAQGQGQVAVDIYEQDNYYIIKAPIAGVRLCDLDIEISDSVVTIRGTRQQGDDVPRDTYYVQECFWGQFSRSVTLPCAVDPKRVRATFNKECILKIIIPKEEKVKIVRINEG